MEIKNEYLITFKKDTHICPTLEKFKSFLGSHKQITFSENRNKHIIEFQSKEFEYTLLEQKTDDGAISYQLSVTAEDSDFEIFKELWRAIRSVVMELKKVKFITLHDDIAKYYCVQGYPIIYEIENLMRRLIYQIMNISKGYEWRDNTIPDEVKNSVKTALKERNEDFFHNVDFIQLSNFLFKPYSEKNDLTAFLQQKDKNQDKSIILVDLEPYRSKSNWDRYFKDKVDVEGEYLKKHWEKLYDIRCAIAHCREISQDEFEQLQQMSQEVSEKLNNALTAINTMNDEQRQELAQNIDRGISGGEKVFSDYISSLNQIKENLKKVGGMLSDGGEELDDIESILIDSLDELERQWRLCSREGRMVIISIARLVRRIKIYIIQLNYNVALDLINSAISDIDKELQKHI